MVSVTLAIPEEVKRGMEKHSEINWSGFIRNKIIEKTEELDWKEEMLKKYKKQKDVIDWAVEIQREGRKGRYQQLKRQGVLE